MSEVREKHNSEISRLEKRNIPNIEKKILELRREHAEERVKLVKETQALSARVEELEAKLAASEKADIMSGAISVLCQRLNNFREHEDMDRSGPRSGI